MFVILFGATAIAYFPALKGGRIWDDDGHITNPELGSLHGLGRIWFEVGATQQYYPVLHSAFWLEHRLWGDAPLGYHLLNALLHATCAGLFVVTLRRLNIRGAALAGMLFALHPVCVESVAWISEQKNTLSLVFYLGAGLTYLQFDQGRRWRTYFFASLLFALALATKTVTATLPAALLLVAWWRHGRLVFRRDWLPMLPWLALGAAAGILTSSLERDLIGAAGAEFSLTMLQRVLLAGRVVWFYLGKLVWPARLMFIYPRWTPDESDAIWWIGLIAVLAVTGLLWWSRHRSRTPLVAWLFFVGSLFPALGFFNIYPFRYSYVADHFQYIAGLGVFAGAGATTAAMWNRATASTRFFVAALAATLPCVLGALTWRQCGLYRDAATLYSAVLARNPDCWMAHNNLGLVCFESGRIPEALAHYEASLALYPANAEAHNNFGNALLKSGRLPEAMQHYEEALRLKPGLVEAHNNLGNALSRSGRFPEAIEQYRLTLRLNPNYSDAYNNLGNALLQTGQHAAAIESYQNALRLKPDDAEAQNGLGLALLNTGRLEPAIAHFRDALRLRPVFAEAHNNLGVALLRAGQVAEATEQFNAALALRPNYGNAHRNLEQARSQRPP